MQIPNVREVLIKRSPSYKRSKAWKDQVMEKPSYGKTKLCKDKVIEIPSC